MAMASNLSTSENYDISEGVVVSAESDQTSEQESFENPASPLLAERDVDFNSFEATEKLGLRGPASEGLLEKNIMLKMEFERKEYKLWVLLSLINFSAIIGNGVTGYLMYISHVRNKPYFDIVEGYDGGKVEQAFFIVLIESGTVFSLGLTVVLCKFLGTTRSRIRFAVYNYVGWTVALLAIMFGGVVAAVVLLHVKEHLFQGYKRSMVQFSLDVRQQMAVHRMQTTLECCGFNNYTEWLEITWSDQIPKMDLGFPKSCCMNDHQNSSERTPCINFASRQNIGSLTPIKQGCKTKITELYGKFLNSVLTSILFALACIISIIILSIILLKAMQKTEDVSMEIRVMELAKKWRLKDTFDMR